MIAITVLMGVAAVLVLRGTTTTSNRLTYEFVGQARDVHELRLHVEQFTSATRGYLLAGSERYREMREAARAAVLRDLENVRVGSHVETDVEPAARLFHDYDEATARAMEARATRPREELDATVAHDVRPHRLALEAHLAEMLAHEDDALDDAFERATRLSRAGQVTLAVTTLVLLVLGFVLAEALRRKLAEQFAAVEAATEAADRAAAARKELLNVVSHDLRSPLNAIMLNLQLVEAGEPPTARVDAIRRSADRMQRLIEELVDVARVDSGQLQLYPTDVDMDELVRSLVPMFAAQAEARGITLAVEASPAQIRIDRDRIVRVLVNLVENALKFTPRGGRIRVAADVTGERARFEVIDTGPGIPADEVGRVFDRAWQSPGRRKSGGLGLGLYICQRIVDAHGGSIGVASVVGEGSTFWFEVPVNASVAG